ncbi:MAG: response regulator transcription factor [Microcystaceae cyanobacterium]
MNEQLSSVSIYTEELEQLPFLKIVSEFHINNSHFLIVALGKNTEDSQRSTLSFSAALLSSSTIGGFEVDEDYYLIIKTQNTPKNPDLVLINLLTERELQIAILAALGKSNKQIANHLYISQWTVASHLRRIFIKLNVDNRAAMAYRCASLIDRVEQLCLSCKLHTGDGIEKANGRTRLSTKIL